jgi:hypothetical protein
LLWLAVSFSSRLHSSLGELLTSGSFGELDRPLTFDSYQRFLGFGSFGWEGLYPSSSHAASRWRPSP